MANFLWISRYLTSVYGRPNYICLQPTLWGFDNAGTRRRVQTVLCWRVCPYRRFSHLPWSHFITMITSMLILCNPHTACWKCPAGGARTKLKRFIVKIFKNSKNWGTIRIILIKSSLKIGAFLKLQETGWMIWSYPPPQCLALQYWVHWFIKH